MSKFIVKPNQSSLPKSPEVPLILDTPASEISIQRLIDDTLLVLDREIRQLKILSARGKLDPAAARDLRDHAKLLFELKKQEKESLQGITDDQLKAEAKKVLGDEN